MLKNALFCPLLAILVLSQPVFAQKISDQILQQISALEMEKDARNPAQKKMDSQLIYAGHKLAKGVASDAVPDMELDVKIHPDGRVLVDITAAVSDDVLKFVEQGGGQVMSSFARYDAIRALMPVGKLEALAARGDVRFVARAHEARTNIGSVTGEGDICHRAAQARAAFGVDGTGVRVGVLSDSASFLTTAQGLGDLGPVTILPGQGGSGSGEGTAMMEIIHDLAPGASLYFATAFAGEASFAANINALVASNCSVIVDDVSYFVESPFQDGQAIAQAVKSASDAGVLYFSSAGNSGNKDSGTSGTWEGDFSDGGGGSSPLPTTGRVHNFGGGTNYTAVTFIDSARADLFWADPLGGSANDYDLYVLNSAGTAIARSSTTTQSGVQDPYESVTTLNAGERIVIFKKTAAAARFLHLDTGRCEISINTAGNVRGHNSSSASNAFCVAAVDVHTSSPFPSPFVGGANNPVETFSSDGPRRIFFQPNGTAITPGNFTSTGGMVFQKPDITAADGASGSTAVPGFSPFYGTSAAAPHAAGVAALLKSFKPLLTPAQMRAALSNSALDIMGAGYDRDSGPGIVMALHALAAASGKPWLLGGTLQLSGGNGNGTVDSNECNNLQFVLQNIGPVTASNVTALLSTTTTGVNVTQPAASYPDILPGGSATNSQPFNLSTVAGFVSGAPISLTLASSYTGGANTNTATLTTSQCPTIQTNAGLSVSSPTQSGRLGRDGIASGCGAAKTCPGAFTTSPRAYNAHSFTNSTSQSVCVTATIATSCDPAGTSNILAVAYLGNFNSASLCTGYLGDPGQSPGPGGLSFAFNVPPLTNFTIVVDAITNGFFCPDYTLSVDGLICPGNGGGLCSVPMLTVTKTGAGNGFVSSAPAGINCGITCAAGFASNSVVTLTAAPGTNAAFTGWTGDCTGAGSCIVTMDVNRAVTATFNVAPMVTGASVIPNPNAFNDEPLTITGLGTFDGDGDTVSVAYQWQFTTNGTVYVDQVGATNATFVAGSGKLWRCRLTPSDAFNTGTNFLTGAVAVNNRPNLLGRHGQPYSYDSDLFFAATGGGGTFTRNALINEFSQGASGSKEWVEVLFLKNSDARGWKLFDSNTSTITFSSNTLWSNVTAGTLLIVYNGSDRDTILPTDGTNVLSGTLVIAHSNATYFSGAWIGLGNGGDSISLSDATNALLDGVSYGSNNSQAPALGAVSAGTSASYTNNTEAGVDVAGNWQITSAGSATPGNGNGTVNSNFVANLRNGAFNQMPLFQLGAGGDPVAGLSIDATNGLYSGTINAPTGGFYNVVIERYSGTNLVSQQYNLLVGDSNDVYRIPAGKTWAINTNYTIPGTLIVSGLLDTAGHTLVVSNTLDVSGGAVSNATGLIVYHKLVGSPLPGASSQFNALPAISAASVSPASPVDTDDLVANVTGASDADGDPITFAYQWQESTNNIAFTTATLTNTATTQGLFYRCVITPNDGIADGSPFTTTAAQIALDLQILSIQSSNMDFVITYSAVSNKTYELQLATDLVLSNWNGVASNTVGNTGSAQFIDVGGLVETQRFYRIKLLP